MMNEAGLAFEVLPADVTEIEDETLGIEALVSQNAKLKSEHIAANHPNATVIGADTLVALRDRPLGKPTDLNHAFQMLKSLIGQTHVVCTGVCLTQHNQRQESFVVQTTVTFRDLSDDQIRAYLGMINPLDKAGSYAAQDHGEFIIESTKGSWTNVVGLPMQELIEALDRFTESK